MKKIKIEMPKNFKELFTITQIETIRNIPKEYDNGVILTLDDVKIGIGQHDEIYKVTATWCLNNSSCFDNNVDIGISAIYRTWKDGKWFIVEKFITLSEIYGICNNPDDYGYIVHKYCEI